MSKADFISSLQHEPKALSPFDISQRLRQQYSCVSTYMGDPDLPITHNRGWMLRFQEKREKTPENPELYICVISLQQPKPWQDLVWAKEILQILDRKSHWTTDATKLAEMLKTRSALAPHAAGTPANVIADKNGFTLALGSIVPRVYRTSLRASRASLPPPHALESTLLVPRDYIDMLLNEDFEDKFETALKQCDD